jgi:hypothetical protein
MGIAAFSALVATGMAAIGGAGFMLFGTAVSAFTYFIGMTATFSVLGAISKSLFSQPSMDTQNGINFNSRDPAATRKIVYGKCRIGGTIVFFNTSDTNNNFFHVVIAVAGHEINAFKEVYFGNTKVWENGSYIVDEDNDIDWEDHCLLKFHKGDQTTADTDLVLAATGFTNDHKLLDTAYIYARLDYDAQVYVSGVPNISCVVEGKKVYDPRDVAHDINDESTWEFSTNPALIAYDYLRDQKYGLGEDNANIDVPSVTVAANDCDDTITITDGAQKRYECSGILDSGSTIKNNLEDILSSMMGSIHYSGGKFHVLAGMYRDAHSDAIGVDIITSPIQVTTKRSRNTLFNTVKGRFVSEENNYVISDFPEQDDSSFVTEDGEELVMDLPLPMTTNNVRAQRIAKLTLKQSRLQMSISLQLNLEGLKYKVGDTVAINYDRFSWSNKEFTITRLQVIPSEEKGLVVDIEATEADETTHDWSADEASEFVVTEDVDVYRGTEVVAPTNLRLYSVHDFNNYGQGTVQAVWDGVLQADGADPHEVYFSHYLVQYTDDGVGNYHDVTIETLVPNAQVFVDQSRKGTNVGTITVRAVNVRGFASDPITISFTHQIQLEPYAQNIDNRVFGTQADPTPVYLSELALEAGIDLINGTELLYIYVDENGFELGSQEYVFDTQELTAIPDLNRTAQVDSITHQNILYDQFFNDDNWTDQSGGVWFVSGGLLQCVDAGVSHFIFSFVQAEAGDHTVQFTINSNDEDLGFVILDSTTFTPLFTDISIEGTGLITRTVTVQGNFYIAFQGSATNPVTAAIDNLTIKPVENVANASQKFKFVASTQNEVTWSFSESNQANITDSGVSTIETGFSGTNLRTAENEPYVTVELRRQSTSTGFSSQDVTVTAQWEEDDVEINNTTVTQVKTLEITRSFAVEVRE